MACKFVGLPCAIYGPYTFYKAFKYTKNGKTNILSLSEFFFVKLWSDSDLVSIGELTLLWEDRNNEQTLACLRLYILPENTPDGRSDVHGEDEVLAITEKVVLRLEDLLTWLTEDADWNWGLGALWQVGGDYRKNPTPTSVNCLNSCSNIDFSDIEKEKESLSSDHWETHRGVIVLSFTRYCRYRGLLRRFEGVHNKWLRNSDVIALGGFNVPYKNTKVLFCKDTFDYPDLEGHELLCNHLAPKYKGRNSKKKKKLLNINLDSDSGSESSSTVSSTNKSPNKSGLKVRLNPSRKSPRISDSHQERDFLHKLYQFMKTRKTPIGKVPSIGFKELDLFKLFFKVKHLGGYEEVTTGRLWKYVFAEIGGEQSTTSAGTLSRKHYERLLLPYEKHLNGDQDNNKTVSNKTPNKSAKVNGNVSINNTSQLNSKKESSASKESPVITLEESSNSSSNSNSNLTSGNSTDKQSNFSIVKRKIVMEGNSSSLRNVRLKLEKPQNGEAVDKPNGNEVVILDNKPVDIKPNEIIKTEKCMNGQVSPPRDKENIPLVNKSGEKRLAPEVIDITDDSGPQSINAYKKQKLDILKYQGLEVTPVSSEDVKPPIAHPPPNLPSTPVITPQVDFHQRERNKISITVTPDVSLLLKPQTSPVTPPPRPSSTPKVFSNPPITTNLFSPFQHGTKTVYGNPKDVFSNPKDLYTGPKNVYNSPNSKETFNSPKEVFSNPKDVYSNPKDVYSNPKDVFSNPKDIFSNPKDMFSNPKDIYNSPKDVYNNPKETFNNPKDLFSNPFNVPNSKETFSNSKPSSLSNSNLNLKDMFTNTNLKEMLSNPQYRDLLLTNAHFKDLFNHPSLKDVFSSSPKDLLMSPSTKPNYLNSPKDTSRHQNFHHQQQPVPPHQQTRFNNLLMKSSPSSSTSLSNQNACNDVLDLKVKTHPTLPATISASGQSLKRTSQQQDEVLDLTVKSGKKDETYSTNSMSNMGRSTSGSNLEITLVPPSHRPYDMKRPLPLPLSRTHHTSSRSSTSPNQNHKISGQPSLHRSDPKPNHSLTQLSQQFKKNTLMMPQSHVQHRSKRKSSSVHVPPSHSKSTTPASPFNNNLLNQNAKNPYMPMIDPMYFAALYSGLFPPNLMNPAAAAALFTPPVSTAQNSSNSNTAQDALNIYKEILKARNSSLFPNLFNDGSTSISLVGNNNKPAPK